jgi:hypothetical protein
MFGAFGHSPFKAIKCGAFAHISGIGKKVSGHDDSKISPDNARMFASAAK